MPRNTIRNGRRRLIGYVSRFAKQVDGLIGLVEYSALTLRELSRSIK
jgi:hypothetical protein